MSIGPSCASSGDTNSSIIRASFDSIQEMCQGHPMLDFSYVQLGRGNFSGDFLIYLLPHGMFWRSRINVAIEGESDIPQGYLLAATATSPRDSWHDRTIVPDALVLGSAATGLVHRTAENHEAWVWLIRYERFLKAAEIMGLKISGLEKLPLLAVGQERLPSLRLDIEEFLAAAQRTPGLTQNQLNLFEDTLIEATLNSLVIEKTRSTRSGVVRPNIAAAVRKVLHQSCDRPLCMVNLCETLGFSERTVRDQFRRHYDISPAAYHLVLRLNHARTLLHSGLSVKGAVSKAASESGFWHMGRFATQYKRQFGESPGETVRRGLTRKPLRVQTS